MTEAVGISLFIMVIILAGTLSGGFSVTIFNKYFYYKYHYLFVFCGGILAGVLGFDLVPDAIRGYDSIGIFAGISLGIMFIFLIDKYVHQHVKQVSFEHPVTFALLFLALFIHSIPAGLAIGLNYKDHHFQELSLLLAFLLHHFPEGMVMMVSVLYSKMQQRVFLLLCLVLSLTVGFSSYLGMAFDIHSSKIRTMFMGIAIGTLGYVTFYEILWKGLKQQLTLRMVMIALVGIGFIGLFHLFSPTGH